MTSLIPTPTQFARPFLFSSFLSFPRKRLDFLRNKSGVLGFDLVLDKEMCSLKVLELIRKGKEEHSLCCCCCYGEEGLESEGDRKLEEEILAFMEKSETPNAFPMRKDLEKAGRVDLIEAIKKRGGWYSFGWDSEEEPTNQENVHKAEAEEMDFDIEELRRKVEKYQKSDSLRRNEDSQPASSSGRSL
ncbi:unnamed protein product [Withania somnifera]